MFSSTSRFKLYVSIVSVDDSTKFYRKSIFEKECQKLVFQTGSAQEISFLDSETNKTISIQIKEDKIIKRVNGKGYQPLLIGIKNGQFKNEGQSFTLEVTFTSGKTFDSFFPIKGEF